MKKIITAAVLLLSFTLFAEESTTPPKTWSVSTHVLSLLTNGVGVETEYHGFGPWGVWGGLYWLGYDSTGYMNEVSGMSLVGGVKYYLGYTASGLDSFFIGPELQYYRMNQKDGDRNSFRQNSTGLLLLAGKRWIMDPIFMETSIGAGAIFYHTMRVDEDFAEMSNSAIDNLNNTEGKIGFTLDLKFLVGYSF